MRSSETIKIISLGVTLVAFIYYFVGYIKVEKPNVAKEYLEADDERHQYGVDVSWTIHRRVSTNYPWIHRNSNHETELNNQSENEDMPIQILGNRQKAYLDHLNGCREYYKDSSSDCDLFEFDRILMNQRQPPSMQNYTKVGFKKVRAPQRVVQLIHDFWKNNQNKKKPEFWDKGNIYVNHWVKPTLMISVDDTSLRGSGHDLKHSIWEAARSTIEDWTGEDISPTSMYGIRVYQEGAVLVPHVDRLPLVASAMVNVAQDVDEDWPIEIYDHDGFAHNVTLSPGDMLLFESHSILHGRPYPLKGRYYAMLFVHFEPTGHSLRHYGTEVPDIEEQYRDATNRAVGGQSSSANQNHLPPYIKRESPEEIHWLSNHPEGWNEPPSHPYGYIEDQKQLNERIRAAASGNVKKLILELSKAELRKEKNNIINERDDYGWQLIHNAASSGKMNAIKLLVENGANVNSRTNGGRGATPLYLAEKKFGASHSSVKYLKSVGALNVPPENIKTEL